MQVSRGSIYRRGDVWTINYTVAGHRVREAVGTNRQLAEAVLKKRVIEAVEDRYFDKRNAGRTPFNEFADTYLPRCTAGLKSAKTESDRVAFWKREFGSRPIGQITRAELQDWQAIKRQNSKPATVNRVMCRLRHMFNRAVDWDLLDKSPMTGLKFLPENNARLRYLSLEDCGRLIDGCIAPHLKAIVTIALHTGMRSGEIRNLEWKDLAFDTGFIIVRDSKNGETRHVPMDVTVTNLFRSWPHSEGSEFVFTNLSGGRIGWLQHGFRKALTRAELTDLHFHDLRHTFASQWMMAGGDLYVLKTILGHKSIAMTQRYAHLSPEYKKAMVGRMEQIWAKPAARSIGKRVEIKDRVLRREPKRRSASQRMTRVKNAPRMVVSPRAR